MNNPQVDKHSAAPLTRRQAIAGALTAAVSGLGYWAFTSDPYVIPPEAALLLKDAPAHPEIPLAKHLFLPPGADYALAQGCDTSISTERLTACSIRYVNLYRPPLLSSVQDILNGKMPPIAPGSLSLGDNYTSESHLSFLRVNRTGDPILIRQLETFRNGRNYTAHNVAVGAGDHEIDLSAGAIYLYSNDSLPLEIRIRGAVQTSYGSTIYTDHPQVKISIEGSLFYGDRSSYLILPLIPASEFFSYSGSTQHFHIDVPREVSIGAGASGLALWVQNNFIGFNRSFRPGIYPRASDQPPFVRRDRASYRVADLVMACNVTLSLLGPESAPLHFTTGEPIESARRRLYYWVGTNREALRCSSEEEQAIERVLESGVEGSAELQQYLRDPPPGARREGYKWSPHGL